SVPFHWLRLKENRGVAEGFDQREPLALEREALACAQQHIARAVLLGDPDLAAVRGQGATRAIHYPEKSSALQVDRHGGSFRVHGVRRSLEPSLPHRAEHRRTGHGLLRRL